MINEACLGSHPQKQQIEGLMLAWREGDLPKVLDPTLMTPEVKHLYRTVPVLSARVLKTFASLISDKTNSKSPVLPGMSAFVEFLREKKLELSLSREFWQEKSYSTYRHFMYSSFRTKEEPKQPKKAQGENIKVVGEWIQKCKI